MDESPEPSPRGDAMDESFDKSPRRDTTPSSGDSPHGSLLGGISGNSLDSTETLKGLLRSGMRAISQFVTKEDDDILQEDCDSVIPVVVCCALVIDQTASSPFVDPTA
jgi:hypothetical protein